jgi:hypothetical protein
MLSPTTTQRYTPLTAAAFIDRRKWRVRDTKGEMQPAIYRFTFGNFEITSVLDGGELSAQFVNAAR